MLPHTRWISGGMAAISGLHTMGLSEGMVTLNTLQTSGTPTVSAPHVIKFPQAWPPSALYT